MRITYDREANAVYIRLSDQAITGQTRTVKSPTPPGVQAWVALDWKTDCLVGIEILDASQRLPDDFLDQAEDITNG